MKVKISGAFLSILLVIAVTVDSVLIRQTVQKLLAKGHIKVKLSSVFVLLLPVIPRTVNPVLICQSVQKLSSKGHFNVKIFYLWIFFISFVDTSCRWPGLDTSNCAKVVSKRAYQGQNLQRLVLDPFGDPYYRQLCLDMQNYSEVVDKRSNFLLHFFAPSDICYHWSLLDAVQKLSTKACYC